MMAEPAPDAMMIARASALRDKLLPMPQGKALAAWAKMGAPSSVGGPQPKDCNAWLQRRSLKLGAVPGDGRCQYTAFSRAAFNDDQFADELQWLAVAYLRLHKSTFYESMQADLQDRHYALRKLVAEEKISSDDYDGFMEALEKGLEWGNDHTLRAMTILMRLEARVIKNLNCPASAMEPRLHGVSKDPRDQVGNILGVIYLFLDREHYSTIEDDLEQPLATNRSTSLSSDVGSVYSERPGSIHTDRDNDITHDYEKPILALGEEYTAGELLGDGVSLGDGTRLVMRTSDSGEEWVISQMYVQGGARALSEVRRLPRILAQGPPKKVRKTAPVAEESWHEFDADPAPEDMQKLAAELSVQRLGATAMLAQNLYELMTHYVSMLNLHRNESDESPLGMLGNEILEILEELKIIKRRLAFTVTADSQPIQQAMVVGVPGAGKSTLVNELMRHCLKMEGDQPSEPEEVEIRDDVFSEGGSTKPGTARQQLQATQRDEEAVLQQTKQDKNVKYRFNISGDDILPTGSGAGAMTALVTHIFLDPTASHLQLRLKYREKAEVDKVLSYAGTIRDHGRAVKSGESLPELPDIPDSSGRDVDVTTQAYFACALLGLENKPDGDKDGDGSDDDSDDDGDDDGDDDKNDPPDAGVEQLQRHVGAFELPKRFDPLYGCERRLTLRGRSKSKLLAQVQELLLVHTIGHWSHWAVLEKVELVVPSNLRAPLRVCDVPGFGDDTLDPFRQQLVNEALKLQCSTLCLVLKHARLKDDAQEAAQRLGKLGIYEDLFGLNKQRRVGKLTTVVALDWAVKEWTEAPNNRSQPREAVQEYIKDTHNHHKKDSQTFLKAKLKRGVQSRLQGTDAAVVKERVDSVMKTKTQAFVVAVREAVVEQYMDEGSEIPWRMRDLVANLLSNNADNLSRQQEDCLEKLVGLCLLPLYSRLDQLGRLRDLGGMQDQRVKMLKEKSLLDGVRSTFENEFGGQANKMRVDKLKASVFDPKMSACTAEAVSKRYNSDKEFDHYRKKSSRKLGNDMRSHHPETTLLPDLTMRPMATEVVLPLQDKLREMMKELIDQPADKLENLIRQIIKRSMEGNMEQAPEQKAGLSSAMATLDHGFVENVRHVKEYFHQKFRTQINQLPNIHAELLHDTLDAEELPLLAKKYKTNIKKRDELGRRAQGGTGMAQDLSRRLQHFLRKEVLDNIKDDFLRRFEKAVKYLIGMVIKAQSGDIADLEQLSAFHYSKNCALRVAGMIHAVHASKLAEDSFARMPRPDLHDILRFAEQPRLALNVGEASGIALLSGAVSRGPSVVAVESSDDGGGSSALVPHVLGADGSETTGEQWHCPSCGVPGSQTDLSQKGLYGLTRPVCLFKSEPDCWCEAVEDHEVCLLCLRMFRDKHKRRDRKTEQSRKSAKRRASFSALDNAKRARNDGAASQSSSSALVQVLQRDERSFDGSVVSV